MEYKWNKTMTKVNMTYQNYYYTLCFKRYYKDRGFFLNDDIKRIIPCKEHTYLELYDFETNSIYEAYSEDFRLTLINVFQNSTNNDKISRNEDEIEIHIKDQDIKLKKKELFHDYKKLNLNLDITRLIKAFDALIIIFHNTNSYIRQFEYFLKDTFLFMINFLNKLFSSK